MFLVTGRARPILHHVRLVEAMFLVTDFAFGIDLIGRDPISKTLTQRWRKVSAGDTGFMTLGAIIRELGVAGRDFSGVEESFVPATLEEKDRDQTTEDHDQTDNESHLPPRMQPAIVAEIAFVPLGDLLLRASGFRHRLSI